VKVNEEYCWDILVSQQMLNANVLFITILSFSVPVHRAFNTVQLLHAVQNSELPFS